MEVISIMFYYDYIEYLCNYESNLYSYENISKRQETELDSINCMKFDDSLTNTKFYIDLDKAKDISNKAMEYMLMQKDIEKIYKLLIDKGNNINFNSSKENSGKYNLMLLGRLPYLVLNESKILDKTSTEKLNSKIKDYVSVRTGILFSSVIATEKEYFKKKDLVRATGLLYGLNCYLGNDNKIIKEYIEKLYGIDEFLYEKMLELERLMVGKESDFGDISLDFVKGSQVKIKQYYFETDKIKNIRGASVILDDVNRNKITNYIKDNFIEENIVYNGGGGFLGIFPSGYGKDVSIKYEKINQDFTLTAQSVAEHESVRLSELINDYENEIDSLMKKFNQRQMSKINWNIEFENRINTNIENLESYYRTNVKDMTNRGEICSCCNFRYAIKLINDEEYQCESCYNKWEKGGRESKVKFISDYLMFLEKDKNLVFEKNSNGKIKINGNNDDKYITFNDRKTIVPNTLGEIAKFDDENEYIGVIYGDGNNMGKLVQNFNSLTQIKYFSNEVDKGIYNSVYNALYEIYKKYYRNSDNNGFDRLLYFEIIAIGGDDIFIIAPGNVALELAVKIGENFDKKFGMLTDNKEDSNKKNMTMSLGVCLSHYNTSIKSLNEKAQNLMKSAKNRAKSINKGTLDFQIIDNENKLLSDNTYTNNVNNCLINGLRPYNWDEAYKIIDTVKKLKEYDYSHNTKSFIGKMKYASMNLNPNEAGLYFLYALSKLDKESIRIINVIKNDLGSCFIERLNKKKEITIEENENLKSANGKDIKGGKLFMKDDVFEPHYCVEKKENIKSIEGIEKTVIENELYSPWIDIEELWSFIYQEKRC
jgi:hypothetical protein